MSFIAIGLMVAASMLVMFTRAKVRIRPVRIVLMLISVILLFYGIIFMFVSLV